MPTLGCVRDRVRGDGCVIISVEHKIPPPFRGEDSVVGKIWVWNPWVFLIPFWCGYRERGGSVVRVNAEADDENVS